MCGPDCLSLRRFRSVRCSPVCGLQTLPGRVLRGISSSATMKQAVLPEHEGHFYVGLDGIDLVESHSADFTDHCLGSGTARTDFLPVASLVL